MEAEENSSQKWEVLWYFVKNTGRLMEIFPEENLSEGFVYPAEDGARRFYSYPSRIKTDFESNPHNEKKISKDWAKTVCEQLSEIGILDYDEKRARRQHSLTPHYYLKFGPEPFIRMMKFFFENVSGIAQWAHIGNSYIREHISEELVRHVLSQKGVEMRRRIRIINWNRTEAPKVFADYYRTSDKFGIDHWTFREYCEAFWKEGEVGRSVKNFRSDPTINLRLPVFPNSATEEEKINKLMELNSRQFRIIHHYARI